MEEQLTREWITFDTAVAETDSATDRRYVWWAVAGKKMPLIFYVVRAVLGLLATSCSPERVFSSAGYTESGRRAMIGRDVLEAITFLKMMTQPDDYLNNPALVEVVARQMSSLYARRRQATAAKKRSAAAAAADVVDLHSPTDDDSDTALSLRHPHKRQRVGDSSAGHPAAQPAAAAAAAAAVQPAAAAACVPLD